LNYSVRLEVTSGGFIRTVAGPPFQTTADVRSAPPLFYRILGQLGIGVKEFRKLK
jgi:hypothetical protein